MTDVVVIGAGIAGVTAARELVRAGLSVRIVEASERIGGRIQTLRDFCGAPVEAGAEFIHGVGAETWPDAQAAGLTTRASPHTRDTMLRLGDGAQWLPLVLLHPATWAAFTILRRIGKLRPPDVSGREFITRQGYRGRARILAEMVLTAHLPGSIDDVGVLGLVADGVLKLETGLNHRIAEGYDRLVEHIGHGLDIEHGWQVNEVRWERSGVALGAIDGRTLQARAAVCTLPVGVLKSGQVRFVPDLPESKRTALQKMEMGPVLKILLHFEEPFWPKSLATLACGLGPVTLYWNVFYRLADPAPVLTAYCTGPRAAALSGLSDDEATAVVLDDLRRLFPRANPKLTASRRIDWATNPLSLGGYTFLKPGGVGARATLAAADSGALFWAGSATATRTIAATVEGAFSSGLRAAQEVRALLDT